MLIVDIIIQVVVLCNKLVLAFGKNIRL